MTEKVEFTKLAPYFYVAGQLEVSDITRLVPLGVNTLVCNRPDGEAGQTSSKLISAAAEAAGIKFLYLPMTNPDDTVSQGIKMKEVLVDGGVVLAYCRTGRRSSALWKATNN